jgi:hypothetical protein
MSTAAKVAARKRQRPDLYCRDCLWMTGGGQCPRHGGPAWTKERQAEAVARSQAPTPRKLEDLKPGDWIP